jgi:hypothetical protein
LLFVSHLRREKENVQIRLDLQKLNLKSRSLSVRDALTGETLPLKDQSLQLPFDGMNFRLLEAH